MKIHLDHFVSNNPDLKFDDVIQNLRIGKTSTGVVNLHFETRDKYLEVDANGSSFGPNYSGNMIYIYPHIYEGERRLERGDAEFYEHPDFWMVKLVVDMDRTTYCEVVIALKHEYFVSYVPDDEVMNYECLQEAEVIEYV